MRDGLLVNHIGVGLWSLVSDLMGEGFRFHSLKAKSEINKC